MNYIPQSHNKQYQEYKFKIGKVFLYDNFIVTEFNEGAEINFESFNDVSELILLRIEIDLLVL